MRWILTAVAFAAGLALIAPAGAHACRGASLSPAELTANEAGDAVRCLINARRRDAGAPKLRTDRRLERAARRHSQAMNAADFFSHNSPRGLSPLSRIHSTGYLAGASSWGIAENIHWGAGPPGTPRVTVKRWMTSRPHRAAMLSRSYREVGIGVALGSPRGAGGNAAIYTADFGFRR